MIKNIVFDMGGVLIDYNMPKKAKSAAKDTKEYDFFMKEIYGKVEWIQADRGLFTFEEAIKKCQKRLNLTDDQVDRIVKTAHNPMPAMPYMYELVSELKSNGYKIYLISNAPNNYPVFSKLIKVFELFDDLFFSCDYKLVKPDYKIYEKFCEVNNLNKEECVFIDDAAPNIEGCINYGMQGILFQNDVYRLREELRDIGVKI